MTSTFSWMDYSDKDRRRALEIIDLFREEDTRDELGIGVIRDAFSDRFFPGTNTIQTRLRYFLFIPWVFQSIRVENDDVDSVAKKIRIQQDRLREALTRGGEKHGVIGFRALEKVQRLPSNIYWHGLQQWGILLSPISELECGRSLARQRRAEAPLRNDDGEVVSAGAVGPWHPGLPDPPEGWRDETTFRLRREEARYLAERIDQTAGDSLLAWLIGDGRSPGDSRFVWEHVDPDALPATLAEALAHARNFSESIHGAALLYNLMLAEEKDLPELVAKYEELIAGWWDRRRARSAELGIWNRDRFWALLLNWLEKRRIRCREFVDAWIAGIETCATAEQVVDHSGLRGLIRQREQQIKGGRARLGNRRALDNWSGASGTAQLDYRWQSPARGFVDDVVRGLRGEE